MIQKKDLIFATMGIGIAIIMGAFGAHYLKSVLTASSLEGFKTGVQYQLFMCVGLLALANVNLGSGKKIRLAINTIKLGVLLFSGSIYLLTIKGLFPAFNFLSIAGPITPIGGLLLIVGWFIVTYHISTNRE